MRGFIGSCNPRSSTGCQNSNYAIGTGCVHSQLYLLLCWFISRQAFLSCPKMVPAVLGDVSQIHTSWKRVSIFEPISPKAQRPTFLGLNQAMYVQLLMQIVNAVVLLIKPGFPTLFRLGMDFTKLHLFGLEMGFTRTRQTGNEEMPYQKQSRQTLRAMIPTSAHLGTLESLTQAAQFTDEERNLATCPLLPNTCHSPQGHSASYMDYAFAPCSCLRKTASEGRSNIPISLQ